MLLLLVDIGNSTTHLGVSLDGKIEKTWCIPTSSKGGAPALMKNVCDNLPRRGERYLDGAAIASVVPAVDALWWEVLQKKFRLQPVWVTSKLPLGIKIHYKPEGTLGADRIANAIGGFKKYGGPLVVADFGTGVTVDVVAENGDYLGGVIGPGIQMVLKALHEGTALLPPVEFRLPSKVLGQDTVSAIRSGAVMVVCGMVKEAVHRLRIELNYKKPVKVVVTGGYGELMAPSLPFVTDVNPMLTMEGLCEIYRRVREK